MSEEKSKERPFKVLGDKLRTIRQKMHESLTEVSGAVEIDEESLLKIEQGKECPSEDILLLLINHFGMREDEAAALWQLAGYDDPQDGPDPQRPDQQNRAMVMIMAVDPRVVYTDSAQITANSNGVIIGFTQGAGTPNAITTAKVGMSREQAYKLLHTLQRTLEASKPRQLPPSSSGDKNKNNQGNSSQ